MRTTTFPRRCRHFDPRTYAFALDGTRACAARAAHSGGGGRHHDVARVVEGAVEPLEHHARGAAVVHHLSPGREAASEKGPGGAQARKRRIELL